MLRTVESVANKCSRTAAGDIKINHSFCLFNCSEELRIPTVGIGTLITDFEAIHRIK